MRIKAEMGHVPPCQRTSKIASKPWKLGKRPGIDSPSQPSGGTSPEHTLTSDFQPLELWANKFPLLSATPFVVRCYGSPSKPMCRPRAAFLSPAQWAPS